MSDSSHKQRQRRRAAGRGGYPTMPALDGMLDAFEADMPGPVRAAFDHLIAKFSSDNPLEVLVNVLIGANESLLIANSGDATEAANSLLAFVYVARKAMRIVEARTPKGGG